MTIGAPLVTRLQATTQITDIVGTPPGSRIYPQRLPQLPTYPAIRYTLLGRTRVQSMQQANNLVQRRVQFDLYAETAAECDNLFAALNVALERFKGTVDGVKIQDIMPDEGSGIENMEQEGELYRVTQDFIVWFEV